jgi:AcrR family transcriptional regulator
MSKQPPGKRPGEKSEEAAEGRVQRRTRNARTEAAILGAAERCLARIALSDLSVADIIAEAGISRATFYLYFPSKYAVVSALLAGVMQQISAAMAPFVIHRDFDEAAAELQRTLRSAIALWAEHQPVLRACHENWHIVPELREGWLAVIGRFTEAVARQIERGREAGLIAQGPPSLAIAAALLWGSDRCFYVSGLHVDPDVPTEADLLEPMLTLWLGGIFGPGAAPG